LVDKGTLVFASLNSIFVRLVFTLTAAFVGLRSIVEILLWLFGGVLLVCQVNLSIRALKNLGSSCNLNAFLLDTRFILLLVGHSSAPTKVGSNRVIEVSVSSAYVHSLLTRLYFHLSKHICVR